MRGRRPARVALLSVGLSATLAALAVAVSMVFIYASGVSPGSALRAYVQGAFGSWTQTAGTVSHAVPLMIVALAWIVVFRGGRLQIGFPGQITVGGIAAAAVVLDVHAVGAVALALALVAAVMAGAVYAGIAAGMFVRWRTNEILSTLLLNLIAVELLDWLVNGPMQAAGGGLAQTDVFSVNSVWPSFFGQPTLQWDIILVPIVLVVISALLTLTSFGLRLRLTGANPVAARYAGIPVVQIGVVAMLISGGLSGLAGSSLVLASGNPSMAGGFEAGYGFEGIVVALLARNSPLGSVASALYFSALGQGNSLVQAELGVPSALLYITQSIVILVLLASTAILDRLQAGRGLKGVDRVGETQSVPGEAEDLVVAAMSPFSPFPRDDT